MLQIAHQRLQSDPEIRMLADALRRHEPLLEWSGKREKPWFETDPMPLHIEEHAFTQAVLYVLARKGYSGVSSPIRSWNTTRR